MNVRKFACTSNLIQKNIETSILPLENQQLCLIPRLLTPHRRDSGGLLRFSSLSTNNFWCYTSVRTSCLFIKIPEKVRLLSVDRFKVSQLFLRLLELFGLAFNMMIKLKFTSYLGDYLFLVSPHHLCCSLMSQSVTLLRVPELT